MAASEETLMSVGHLNRPNVNTFSIHRNLRGNMHKRSTQKPIALQYDFSSQRRQMLHTIRLQQRWQELKDRESAAQHHNQELMQKFDRAQDTLKEMMAATAAMKSIRMEYDQFLVESYPCRQKQQKKKSQVHHKTMMAEYMKMCLKREEEYGSTSSVKKALYSHNHGRDPQKDAVAQAYNGQGGSYPSFMDSPSHSQSDQTMATSVVPSTLLPCPQGFQLQHLVSTPPQNAPGWALDQADGPRSSVEDAETSSFSRRMSVHLSQELDFKPVRLSSEHVENRGDNTSSSSSSSSSVCGRMKCDRKKSNTSEKNRRSSQKSSKTSSSVGAKTSESEASSHKGSTSSKMRRNITALVAGLPMTNHNETRERESPKSRSISETQSEHEVSQSLLNQSDSNRGNSPSRSEESSSGSDTAGGKKDNEGLEEDKEADSKSDEIEESDVEGDSEDEEASPEDERENESDKDRGSDDISDKLKKQNKEQDSALLQDEEEHDDQSEDESDEEEQAEERDSDDVIISHQQNKPRVHFTLQEASEDDDGNEGATTATSDEDSSDPADDDIENLLAPHPQTRKEKDTKTVEPDSTTPKVICNVELFRGETHTDQQSDSDEFDHFYD